MNNHSVNRSMLMRIVTGSLRSALSAHPGCLNPELIGSIAKRVSSQIDVTCNIQPKAKSATHRHDASHHTP
jgi:hypothetical protein